MTGYATARWVFFRLLGIVYLFAFWSLANQIVGLLGHDGVQPAQIYMAAARDWAGAQHLGIDRFRVLPTLFWLTAGDAALRTVCVAGILLSLLLFAGVAPLLVAPLLWLCYLSLSVVAREFLSFQWDALLLESGLLAVFVAPAGWTDPFTSRVDPPRAGVWLFQWLLLRFMLGSGLVKLASGDPTWRSLTALTYHYETQPIPTPLAWYAHLLPVWFHKASTLMTLAIELVAPFLMLMPRRWLRMAACTMFVMLQAVIAATGNYAFFNLLTASLCAFILDDAALTGTAVAAGAPRRLTRRVQGALAVAAALVILPVSAAIFARSVGVVLPGAEQVEAVAAIVSPLRSINSYGLFAVMTTRRPEIIIEGSNDGNAWQPYEFKYKVGDPRRRPPWVAPFQPRLDWQMWFAALGAAEDNGWFDSLCTRLLEGSPDVLRLLSYDPFGGRPPKYVRALLYQYHFADWQTRRTQGVWWTRELLGVYLPPTSLERTGVNSKS